MGAVKDQVTVKELSDMKYDTEFELMEIINRKIREIRYQTGVSVQDVQVDLVDITQSGNERSDFAVNNVNLELDLEEGK